MKKRLSAETPIEEYFKAIQIDCKLDDAGDAKQAK